MPAKHVHVFNGLQRCKSARPRGRSGAARRRVPRLDSAHGHLAAMLATAQLHRRSTTHYTAHVSHLEVLLMTDPAPFLRALFDRAVAVADPMQSLAAYLPARPDGRLVVVGAGKASARMAEAVEAAYGPCEGLVITRYGYARPCQGIEIVEAAHPVPDAAGQRASERMLALLDGLSADDFVLALISGGASSLLIAPVPGVTLAKKQAVN